MKSVSKKQTETSYQCRACKSHSISNFEFNHLIFRAKPAQWDNVYCHECGVISHFKTIGKLVNYADQEYRKGQATVYPPIVLPWSTISFKRWKHISEIIERNLDKSQLSSCSILDYGGYNGLLARAFKQHWGAKCTVADLDQEGLDFAKTMGCHTINLDHEQLNESYDLIFLVHVLEHLQDPSSSISAITQALKECGSLYIEVPNLYGFPLSDEAHLSTFTLDSLVYLCQKNGLEILSSGHCQTPSDSINFNYPYSTKKENIYVLAKKGPDAKDLNIPLPASLIKQKEIKSLANKLTKNYGLRSLSMSKSHISLGISQVIMGGVYFFAGLISLIPIINKVVSSPRVLQFAAMFKSILRTRAKKENQ